MGTPMQLKLFQMEVHLSDMKRRAVGSAGEVMALMLLERSGYEVVTLPPSARRGDLLAISKATGESWRVEVKTARRNADGRWKFNLVKDGHTDCKCSDVVLLLAILKTGRAVPFVISVTHIGKLRSIQFRSHPLDYSGRWAKYRQGKTLMLEVVNAND